MSSTKKLSLLERYNRLVPRFLMFDPTFPLITPNYIVLDISKARPQDYLNDDEFVLQDHLREYNNLTIIQRIFVTFEYSNYSYLSAFVGFVIQGSIIIGVVSVILQSSNEYQYTPTTCDSPVCNNDATLCPGVQVCEPIPLDYFFTIDAVIIAVFSFDFIVRALTCLSVPARIANIVPSKWDIVEKMEAFLEKRSVALDPKPYKKWYHLYQYVFSWNNIVDIVSILPFYITLSEGGGSAGTSTSFLRVARLFRILRIVRLGDPKSPTLGILTATVTKSAEALAYNVFFFILVIIVFGSIIFLIEQGTFQVNDNFSTYDGWQNGFYIRTNIYGISEISPFKSVSAGMYWAAVTLTTLGYGDLYPTSEAGRFIGSICAMCGILVLAIPVSVVGSIFTELYSLTKKKQKKQRNVQKAVKILNKKLENGAKNVTQSDSLDAMELSTIYKSAKSDDDDDNDEDEDDLAEFETNPTYGGDDNDNANDKSTKSERFNGATFHKSMNALEVYTKLKTLSSISGTRSIVMSDLLFLLRKLTADHAKLAEKYGEVQEISRVLQKEMNIINKCLPQINDLFDRLDQHQQPLSVDVSVKDIIAKARSSVKNV